MTGKRSSKRRIFLLLLLLIVVPATLLWLYAAPAASWAARRYLASFDLEVRQLDGLELSLGGFGIAGLTLANEGLLLSATGISAEFALPRIEMVEVSSLRLEVPLREAGGAEPLPELGAVLQTLHGLPIGRLEIGELRIVSGATEFQGRLLASGAPPRLELDIESPRVFSLRVTSENVESLSGVLDGPAGVQASFDGNVAGSVINGALEAALELRQFAELLESSASVPAGHIELSGPFSLTVADSDFTFASDSLALDAPELILNDLPAFRSRFQLEQVVARYWRAGAVEAGRWYALGYFDSSLLELPYLSRTHLNGSLQLSGSGLRAAARLAVGELANVDVELLHRFDDGTGFADIEIPEFRFDNENPLSALLSVELPEGDVIDGTVAGAGSVNWSGGDFRGGMLARLKDLSGYFEETAFLDLDTDVEIELTPEFGLRNAAPLEAALSRIDPGLPLEDLRWDYSFDSASQILDVRQFQAALLDGLISVPSLRLESGRPLPDLNLILTDVDLAAVTGLANYDDLAVTGRVSGYLPIRIEPDGVRIEYGLIGALQPGGTIRYMPEQPAADPRMQTVNELLSNYHFETLNSYVQLDESGDLRLQVEITGTNPSANPGQPINLNMNIVDNIPELLRSLRAGREISQILADQLNQR